MCKDSQAAATGSAPSADGVPIAFESHGHGSPALVLVHGWACDRGNWSAQAGPLSAGRRVVTLDLAGHGESGAARRDWTIGSFGEDVAAVVNALALESVVLIGHSMGGDVILQAARRLPGRVAGLVMLDTYKKLGAPMSDDAIERFAAKLAADFTGAMQSLVRSLFSRHAGPALVDRVAADMAAAPPAVAIPTIRSSFLHAREVPALIEELAIPVFAVNPDNEPTDVDGLEQRGVAVRIVAGAGHFLMMEKPDAVNALLLDIVGDIS